MVEWKEEGCARGRLQQTPKGKIGEMEREREDEEKERER
jgi:hypothetical protein